MSNNYFSRARQLAILVEITIGGSLGGCAVYVPTVPSTPLVQSHEAEITAGFRGVSSLEATAAWSPMAHVFFNVEGALQAGKTTSTINGVATEYNDYHRQVSFGIGAYTVTKAVRPLYLAAVAGQGFANVDVHPIELFGSFARYQSNYKRYYGQLYLAQLEEKFSWGLSVRATWVDYAGLLQDGNPLVVSNRWFAEPHFFIRGGGGPLQGYATLGLSMPVVRDAQSPGVGIRVFSPTSVLLGAGLVLRPQLLKRAGK